MAILARRRLRRRRSRRASPGARPRGRLSGARALDLCGSRRPASRSARPLGPCWPAGANRRDPKPAPPDQSCLAPRQSRWAPWTREPIEHISNDRPGR